MENTLLPAFTFKNDFAKEDDEDEEKEEEEDTGDDVDDGGDGDGDDGGEACAIVCGNSQSQVIMIYTVSIPKVEGGRGVECCLQLLMNRH